MTGSGGTATLCSRRVQLHYVCRLSQISAANLKTHLITDRHAPSYTDRPFSYGYEEQAYGYEDQAYSPNSEPPTPPTISLSESTYPAQVSAVGYIDSHTIERLPSSDVRLVDRYLERCIISGSKKWTCHYPNCESTISWKNKDAARNHVYKHLNETRLFKCVEWYGRRWVHS